MWLLVLLLLSPAVAAGVIAQKLRGRIGLLWGGGLALLMFGVNVLAEQVFGATGLRSPVGAELVAIGRNFAAGAGVPVESAGAAFELGVDFVGDLTAFLFGLIAAGLILTLPKAATAPTMAGVAPTAGASDLRDCPHCAEPIRLAAKLCRHCGREVTPVEPPRPMTAAERARADRAFPAPDLQALERRTQRPADTK